MLSLLLTFISKIPNVKPYPDVQIYWLSRRSFQICKSLLLFDDIGYSDVQNVCYLDVHSNFDKFIYFVISDVNMYGYLDVHFKYEELS